MLTHFLRLIRIWCQPPIATLLILLAMPQPGVAQPGSNVFRAITPLGDDLYDVRVGDQHTIFAVTSDSIVVVDPLSVDTALWLQREFEQRFPGKPVGYVLLTHHHAERAAGDGAFRGAGIVAQEEFADALRDTSRGKAAAYRYVVNPTKTLADRLEIAVGGKTIELTHVGPFHSRDLTVVSFPWARKAFTVDAPPIRTTPFAFGSLNAAEVVTWLTAVARINFDTLLLGDGTTMTRDQIAPLADYLSRMRAEVVSEYGKGRSLTRLQETMRLDAYRSLPHYAARREQIASIFQQVGYARVDVVVTGFAHYLPENLPAYCNGYDSCTSGGALAGGSVAATVAVGRKFGAQLELASSDQFWATRTRPHYQEEVVFRPSRASVLFRYSPLKGALSYALLAGVSRSFGDVAGLDRVDGRLIPAGGRHDISRHADRIAYTAGIDLSQRIGALRLVFPLRVTYASGELPPYWPSSYDAQAGVGLAIPLMRRLQ